MRSSPLLLAAAPLFAACSSTTPLSLIITAGQEADAFTACKATTFEVDVTSLDGTINLSEKNVPVGGSFDLGNVDATQQVTVAVTGFDAAGAVVMKGSSLAGILLQAVQTGIPVFVECVDRWSRPPGGLVHAHVGGTACVETEEYLLLTGGTPATGDPSADTTVVDAYDVGTLDGASTTAYARIPETCVSLGQSMLLLDAKGATWVDFDVQTQADATLPTNLAAFGDVAGGQVVIAPPDSMKVPRYFVVGGTRPGTPTPAVLEVDGNQTLTAFTLVQPRAGAAATWVDNVGLVVAGGSTSTLYPGVGILADGATAFAGANFAPDATVGAGGVFDGSAGMLLFGGVTGSTPAGTRWLPSLTCDQQTPCAPKPPPLTLPADLVNVSAYAVGGGNTLVVGSELAAPGLDRTFFASLSGAKVVELPLREPRLGATPLPTPVGSLALLGGQHPDGTPATNVELLFPTTTAP